MRQPLRCVFLLATAMLLPPCRAATDQPNKALKQAQLLSSLTGTGARPFHLKLHVSEPAISDSAYSATIEEYWLSAADWYRSVEAPGFRQLITVKKGKRLEQVTGDYYPIWLRSFVTAAIDPLEDAPFWEKVSARIVVMNSTGGQVSSSCARAQFKLGTATLNNDGFAVICFNADGTLASVVKPGYEMEFRDARAFGKKKIAYEYIDDPEPGTNLVGKVQVLESISDITEPGMSAPDSTSSSPIVSVPVGQEMFESLLSVPVKLSWPAVHSGNTNGKLTMYVSADRDGHIREAYPLNSDNAGLQDAARDQLVKWTLRPATVAGQRVQTEAALTFSFSTTLDQPAAASSDASIASSPIGALGGKPIKISNGVSAAMRVKFYAPVYPQELKERRISGRVDLTAIIGKDGHVVSLVLVQSTDARFTDAAIPAVQKWVYRPYLLNGTPIEIETPISVIFEAP